MARYFHISFYALILTAFVALAETGRVDVPAVLIFLVGFGATANRALRGRPPLLDSRWAFFLSVGYILFFFVDAILLSRSFISAILHLVLFLELAKLAQKKEDKDYLYLILLAFLQILAASSLTIDISFVLTLLLFLVALVSTLMSFDIYRSGRETTSASPIRIDGPLGGMAVWATIWIVVIAVGLFFVIPRVGTGYFSRAASEALLLSGFTESVELGEIGQVKLSSALVMRTRRLDGAGRTAPKWRGVALDTFDGHKWYKTNRTRRLLRRSPDRQYRIRPFDGRGERITFEVFLEPLATTALFGPHAIRTVSGDFRGIERDAGDSIYKRAQSVRRTRYEVVSEVQTRMPSEEADVPGLAAEAQQIHLQLPPNLDPRIVDLARTVTANGNSVVEKASLLESYLKRENAYSLDLTWDPGDQPLSTFLFEAKSGHCEYFASSMAIMLRVVGVPTRMVNGFLSGEFNTIGGSYIVRQSDAHSWVEAYVPGSGWMEFDPTPPDPNRTELSMLVLISHYFDAAELFWNSYILSYDSGAQLQFFTSAQEAIRSSQRALRRRSDRWVVATQALSDRLSADLRKVVETVWFWSGVVGLLAAGFVWKHRRRIRTRWKVWMARRGRQDVDLDVVSELFYQAAALAARKSPGRLPHQTWREWAGSLPEGKRSIISVGLNVFEKARYGGSQITSEEFSDLEDTLGKLRGRQQPA